MPSASSYRIDETAIKAALKAHPDPVDALVAVRPDRAALLAEPRLLHVLGESDPKWRTEGDKLRLRRRGKKFIDITEHEAFYADQVAELTAGKPSMSLCLMHHVVFY